MPESSGDSVSCCETTQNPNENDSRIRHCPYRVPTLNKRTPGTSQVSQIDEIAEIVLGNREENIDDVSVWGLIGLPPETD